ncbi:heparan sulfate 2-O-sulfotransferase pipe-like isoform X2 [Amphibalanus amphitrite]|uniref:heparan sulfate 2-O-sulfotransferase pipe-like isoform X2 n=1 Tax=Amphibalanus amphitrite TaxID=1232801 RepID=UPI001C903263|nr:heparan sulfate 2-O-sulfotransferase pipe-like isoform X2 [Amphibalanus amphitrite]
MDLPTKPASSGSHRMCRCITVLFMASGFFLVLLVYGSGPWQPANWPPLTEVVEQQQLDPDRSEDESWKRFIQTRGKNRTVNSRIVFYNRVDKCGSSSLTTLIKRLVMRNRKFTTSSSEVYFRRYLNDTDQLAVIKKLIKQSKKKPLIFDRHVYYIDFAEFNRSEPIYINLIRHPVQRFISFFHYLRLDKRYKKATQRPKRQWFNKSLNECVISGDPECAMTDTYLHKGPKGNEVFHPMTSFFCGHEPVCREFNNRVALQRALENLEKKYAVVGILETLDRSLQVFQAFVPMYFRNAVKLFGKSPLKSNTNQHEPATAAVEEELASRLWADIELYRFAEQRLYLQYRSIGGRVPPGAKF